MFPHYSGQSLLEQKRQQWAKEREEMSSFTGLWGMLDKPSNKGSTTEPRRSSLLPPIQPKAEELKDNEEESETSGYISDSPQHESDSSAETQSSAWTVKSSNYWGEQKAQKNMRNESRLRGTPDSLLSTPAEDRMKWGDRGVGVGHLWEPVVEMPDSRLPQVFEAYRATPRWVERGLKLADGNQADILVIQHDDGDNAKKGNYLLGQNAPVPPEILEERERKRRKALEHQNAIMKQLEERERKRKEEKEIKIREEMLEEERLAREREKERLRQEEEIRKVKEKQAIEKKKEEAMKEALEAAERQAREEKKKLKRRESSEEGLPDLDVKAVKSEPVKHSPIPTPRPKTRQGPPPEAVNEAPQEMGKELKDSSSQAEEGLCRLMTDSGVQSQAMHGLQFLNVGNVSEGGLALVLDGGPPGGLLVSQDAVQLLLMSPTSHNLPALPTQKPERILTPSKLRRSNHVSDATTQTDGKCCSFSLNSFRSRRCARFSGRTSGRSDSSDKSASLEQLHSHAHCSSSVYKQRSRSQPRLLVGDRPKWGINRPTVQYMKQSEKDPHYLRRVKRRSRRLKESHDSSNAIGKLLESDFRLLPFQTDEEIDKKNYGETDGAENEEKLLRNGFRMVSNPSSPRFVRIDRKSTCQNEDFEVTVIENLENESDHIDSLNPGLGNKDADKMKPVDYVKTSESSDPRSASPESLGEESSTSGVESIGADENASSPTIPSNSSATIPAVGVVEDPQDDENIGSCVDALEFAPPNDKVADCADTRTLQDEVQLNDVIVLNEPQHNTASNFMENLTTDNNPSDVVEEDDDDEDNCSVVSGSLFPNRTSRPSIDALAQITALKLGLERLHHDLDSGCSSPIED